MISWGLTHLPATPSTSFEVQVFLEGRKKLTKSPSQSMSILLSKRQINWAFLKNLTCIKSQSGQPIILYANPSLFLIPGPSYNLEMVIRNMSQILEIIVCLQSVQIAAINRFDNGPISSNRPKGELGSGVSLDIYKKTIQ